MQFLLKKRLLIIRVYIKVRVFALSNGKYMGTFLKQLHIVWILLNYNN